MATYKKRGFKNKASSSKAEALEKKSTTANVFNTLDEGSSQTQQWVERNQNKILGLVAVISFIVIGVFAYSKLIKEPKESNAFNKMYFAQKKFDEAVLINNDSLYNIALNYNSSHILENILLLSLHLNFSYMFYCHRNNIHDFF